MLLDCNVKLNFKIGIKNINKTVSRVLELILVFMNILN